MKTGQSVTVIAQDYSWIHGIVTYIEAGSGRFKVNDLPKSIFPAKKNEQAKEWLYSEHDVVGSLAKSYFGVPE